MQSPVGFQAGPECLDWRPWGMDRRISTDGETNDLAGLTYRQALDRVVTLASEYRWKEMNGVAVVRPVSAWTDPDDVLNKDVEPFSVSNEPVQAALYVMLHRPESASPTARINAVRASLTFRGGTRLDGLNALTRTYGLGGWEAITVAEHPPGYPAGPLLVLGFRASGRPYGPGMTNFLALREFR